MTQDRDANTDQTRYEVYVGSPSGAMELFYVMASTPEEAFEIAEDEAQSILTRPQAYEAYEHGRNLMHKRWTDYE